MKPLPNDTTQHIATLLTQYLQAKPNNRNTPVQHIAPLLGPPCCHMLRVHSHPQRPRSFTNHDLWPSPTRFRFEWLCKHNRLRPEPIRFSRLDSEHAQSDGKSVNRGLPLLDLARGRDSSCWPTYLANTWHATCLANNVAICCVEMLRSFGRGLRGQYPITKLTN